MRLLAAYFLVSLILSVAVEAQELRSQLVGRWNLQVEGADGDYPAWLEVSSSGYSGLIGAYVGSIGSMRPIAKIETVGNEFHFSIPPQWEQLSEDRRFQGRLEGDRLIGEMNGPRGTTERWIGTRAPELDSDVSPVWREPISLFNGENLGGWHAKSQDLENRWAVKDGILINEAQGTDLVSNAKFDDFILSAEFRYPPGSNSGIYLRGRYEIQIMDSYGDRANRHSLGSVYGHLIPSFNAAKPAGEWQDLEITLVGRRITVVLNGTIVIDRRIIPGITGGAMDNDEASPGPVMIQGDHGPIEFRSIVITPTES